jgi:hypothetical protein
MSRVISIVFVLSLLSAFSACRSRTSVHVKGNPAPSSHVVIHTNNDPCFDGAPGCGNTHGKKYGHHKNKKNKKCKKYKKCN